MMMMLISKLKQIVKKEHFAASIFALDGSLHPNNQTKTIPKLISILKEPHLWQTCANRYNDT
jgi:hypothetical protein